MICRFSNQFHEFLMQTFAFGVICRLQPANMASPNRLQHLALHVQPVLLCFQGSLIYWVAQLISLSELSIQMHH